MARTMIALAAALILVSLGSIPATAELKTGTVACGLVECVDVWKFQCAASTTLHTSVRTTKNATLIVTLVSNLPASIKGKADSKIADLVGAFSGEAELSVVNNTTISGFALVASLGVEGPSYDIDFHCHKKNSDIFINPVSITLIQNQ
jgi:hypothetical protein